MLDCSANCKCFTLRITLINISHSVFCAVVCKHCIHSVLEKPSTDLKPFDSLTEFSDITVINKASIVREDSTFLFACLSCSSSDEFMNKGPFDFPIPIYGVTSGALEIIIQINL